MHILTQTSLKDLTEASDFNAPKARPPIHLNTSRICKAQGPTCHLAMSCSWLKPPAAKRYQICWFIQHISTARSRKASNRTHPIQDHPNLTPSSPINVLIPKPSSPKRRTNCKNASEKTHATALQSPPHREGPVSGLSFASKNNLPLWRSVQGLHRVVDLGC